MIIQFVLDILLGVVKLIFSVLPTVPAMPSAITSASSWVTDQISNAMSIINMVYGDTLMAAITIVIVAMFTFEWLYHSAMWIIRKVPIWNIE